MHNERAQTPRGSGQSPDQLIHVIWFNLLFPGRKVRWPLKHPCFYLRERNDDPKQLVNQAQADHD